MLYMKPKTGCIVRRPDGKLLLPQGASVPNTSFWRRRLKAGDCIACKSPRERAAAAAAAAARPVPASKKPKPGSKKATSGNKAAANHDSEKESTSD